MKILSFATLALASALCITGCKKSEEDGPLTVTVAYDGVSVEGELNPFVTLTQGSKYEVKFTETGASVEVDLLMEPVIYAQNPSITLTLLDEDKNPVGDFANFAPADAEKFANDLTAYRENAETFKVKFTTEAAGIKLTEENIATLEEKAKYIAATASTGVHTWHFTGMIGGKYPIHMTLASDCQSGTYYYDKSGVNNYMVLVPGFRDKDGTWNMSEENIQGMTCGEWQFNFIPEGADTKTTITVNGYKEYSQPLTLVDEPAQGAWSPERHGTSSSSSTSSLEDEIEANDWSINDKGDLVDAAGKIIKTYNQLLKEYGDNYKDIVDNYASMALDIAADQLKNIDNLDEKLDKAGKDLNKNLEKAADALNALDDLSF